MRLQRAVTWYLAYGAAAAVMTLIAMLLYGKASPYAVVAGGWMAFMAGKAIICCLPVLLPATWLVSGSGDSPTPAMLIFGGLFGVIALVMVERFGFTDPGLASEAIVPVALIGAVAGGIAEAVTRSW